MSSKLRFSSSGLILSVLFFLGVSCAAQSSAEEIARSGPSRVSLIEAYTSDGCSSCPPAEEWVSRLTKNPELWKKFVPVVFHVDYWDYLGWKDVLGNKRFSDRQRAYADLWGNDHVYTPGFVLNGKEWRDWESMRAIDDADASQAGELTVEKNTEGQFIVVFKADPKKGPYTAHAALVGFDLASNITAGENEGRRLVHDFAVVDLVEVPLETAATSGQFGCKLDLDTTRWPSSKKMALAVWVSKQNDETPLQAAGAYLESQIK